ncbi:Mtl1p KNAG_0D03840 [Huiozyma naganishii CBS 8797]|uniref:Mid2 domain-containing protein n=1 Tax=Huiozyma naganishii (strain ATCC MYA-139 / BCRC 22969 / CBS 8797 / KCTC 17520 / NBRC 10181 / NCYC 3082 / Yp74L-3) TaxID=1071383 RepID=J7R5J8_HUIN7|nr:hypothetical protein KNAG_0D03840 [Kazachstania naganishii CBS 8797]CCK70130.1 hypothetical protein KNAG_0D03840 [Kazachstania naganishii CBS 8797]
MIFRVWIPLWLISLLSVFIWTVRAQNIVPDQFQGGTGNGNGNSNSNSNDTTVPPPQQSTADTSTFDSIFNTPTTTRDTTTPTTSSFPRIVVPSSQEYTYSSFSPEPFTSSTFPTTTSSSSVYIAPSVAPLTSSSIPTFSSTPVGVQSSSSQIIESSSMSPSSVYIPPSSQSTPISTQSSVATSSFASTAPVSSISAVASSLSTTRVSSSSSFVPSTTLSSIRISSLSSSRSRQPSSISSSTRRTSTVVSSTTHSSVSSSSSISTRSSSSSRSSSILFSTTTSDTDMTITSVIQGKTILSDMYTTVTLSASATATGEKKSTHRGGLSKKNRNIVLGCCLGIGIPFLIIVLILLYHFCISPRRESFIDSDGQVITSYRRNPFVRLWYDIIGKQSHDEDGVLAQSPIADDNDEAFIPGMDEGYDMSYADYDGLANHRGNSMREDALRNSDPTAGTSGNGYFAEKIDSPTRTTADTSTDINANSYTSSSESFDHAPRNFNITNY